jgi:hypothetical protein
MLIYRRAMETWEPIKFNYDSAEAALDNSFRSAQLLICRWTGFLTVIHQHFND